MVEKGDLVVLGVVQEQHAERARLYAQWRGFDWPIVQDCATFLGLTGVPKALFIDEHGVVRNTRPKRRQLAEFAKERFKAPKKEVGDSRSSQDEAVSENLKAADEALVWRKTATALDDAIGRYHAAVLEDPKNAAIRFRLGVCYRARFDSPKARRGDFVAAVRNWSDALALRPNQYIWRRRIQQYGPKEQKPYPFYDWVATARSEILARGEKPSPLRVTLTGAEIAKPSRSFESQGAADKNPDPKGLITRDPGLIEMTVVVVPVNPKAGETVRVHLRFAPSKGKWNNEGEPLQLWIEADGNARPSARKLTMPNPAGAESGEVRLLDFEFSTPSDEKVVHIRGFALYNACEKSGGTCRYLRKDIDVKLTLKP